MKNREQVLGVRFQGKTNARFLNSLTPSTWHLAPDSRGFTLVEMMVSISLFGVIMLVSVGALLSLVDANRKARSLESVMNNLNISLDSMVRAIRMGTHYNCGSTAIPQAPNWGDCAQGVAPLTIVPAVFSFAPYGSNPAAQTERTVYSIANDAQGRARLYRSQNGGSASIPVTAPEVEIEEMQMYVVGSAPQDVTQPKVVIVVRGAAGEDGTNIRTTFYIQATAVQRALDI